MTTKNKRCFILFYLIGLFLITGVLIDNIILSFISHKGMYTKIIDIRAVRKLLKDAGLEPREALYYRQVEEKKEQKESH